MFASVRLVQLTLGGNMNDMAIGRCRLNQFNQLRVVRGTILPRLLHLYRHWINNIVAPVVNQNKTVELCDILQQAFGAIRRPHNQNGMFSEKLVVMFIDGTLTLGDNLLATARELNRRRITLAVIVVSAPTLEVSSYYRDLADHTGGKYMLLRNAKAILSDVILSVMNGENTLCQAFRQIRIPCVLMVNDDMDNMIEKNQITDGVGDLSFNHGLAE